MPATKAYTRVNFENYPSTNTPLNATNLNKVDKGIDDLDDLLVTARNNIESLQSNATTDEANILALQGSVAALNGFTFYPTGEVNLVALVADDSFYTDANDKYVLAYSTTGQTLIDGVTYKALASTEDTRGEVGADTALPFSKDDFVHISGKFTLGDTSGLQRFTGTLNLNSNKYNGFQKDLFTFSVGSGSATSVSLVSATITNGVLTMSVNANASSGSYINFNLVMCSANTRNKITNVSIVGRR